MADEQKKLQRDLAVEIGGTGTFELDGYIRDKVIPELGGHQGRKVFAKMKTDATISAILFAIEMMLRRSDWDCSPKNQNDEKAVKYAEFFESLRTDMFYTWENFITNVMSMLVYGWSFFEIVAKRRLGYDAEISSNHNDGLWGVHKLAPRGQDTLWWWDLDENGNPIAMRQYIYYGAKAGERVIPLSKGLLFRASFWEDSPEGISPLRGAYGPWLLLQGIDRAEAYGIERELNGLPVMRVPAQVLEGAKNGNPACKEAVDKFTQIVRDVRLNRQAGVLLPSDNFENADGTVTPQKQYELALLSSNGTRAINVQAAAERHQVSIARCVLADFLMLGTTSRSGSQALGKSRFDFFANALDGWNDSIAETLNRHLIPQVARMNGFDMDKLPEYRASSVNPVDVEKVATVIEKYVKSGGTLLPDPEVDEDIRARLGLPACDPALVAANQYDPTLDPRQPIPGQSPQDLAQNPGNAQGNVTGNNPTPPTPTNQPRGWARKIRKGVRSGRTYR